MVRWKNFKLPDDIVPMTFQKLDGKVDDKVVTYQHPRGELEQHYSHGKIVSVDSQTSLVYHTCATENGSSGSPILRNGRVYAVHRAFNTLRKCGEGILLSAIIDDVSINSINLLYYFLVSF